MLYLLLVYELLVYELLVYAIREFAVYTPVLQTLTHKHTYVCRPGVACSVSGVGEVIIRACLAKECCHRMVNLDLPVDEACSQVMQESTIQVC